MNDKEILQINDDFYPTPNSLIQKMVSKVDWDRVKYILEPSAGKGNIINYLLEEKDKQHFYIQHNLSEYVEKGNKKIISFEKIYAIEKEIILRESFLHKLNCKVIDSDFLAFNGGLQLDLIIMNPPFSEGEHHLLKAIDILYSGQIVCLLNAETIRNPYTNFRKELVRKLEELNAEIEYLPDEFVHAERKTNVEVALIYINKNIDVDTNFILEDLTTEKKDLTNVTDEIKDNTQIAKRDEIHNIVVEYNQIKEYTQKQIVDFYKRYNIIGKYVSLMIKGKEKQSYSWEIGENRDKESIINEMRNMLNEVQDNLKQDYWNKTLDLSCIDKYLCSKDKEEIRCRFDKLKEMEFNENNIRQFIINIIRMYPQKVKQNIIRIFQELTSYALNDRYEERNEYLKSIHYFNGWKTNKAYKINKKVIIPMYLSYGFNGKLKDFTDYNYHNYDLLCDLETVLMYVSGNDKLNYTCAYAINNAFSQGIRKNIKTQFYTVTFYKKGTCHIVFNDDEILRRFNIEACKGLKFLPDNYADREYDDLTPEEQVMVNNFEDKNSYKVIDNFNNKFLNPNNSIIRNLLPA